jgi:hypothetical protein
MSNQEFRGDFSGGQPGSQDMAGSQGTSSQGATTSVRDAASDALTQASELAKDAGAKARQAASETASTVADHVKDLLDRQLGTGADMAGQFAHAARLAADDLTKQSPVLGGVVRTVADRSKATRENGRTRRSIRSSVPHRTSRAASPRWCSERPRLPVSSCSER